MFNGESRKQKALFAAADGFALLLAFFSALWLHDPAGAMENRLLNSNPAILALGLVVLSLLWILVFHACDLYRIRSGGLSAYAAIAKGCTIAGLLTLLALFFAHIEVSRLTALLAYLLSVPLVIAVRESVRVCIRRFYSNPKIAIPLVIVGFNPIARYLCDQLLDEITPYELIGFLDDETVGRQYRGYPVLGGVERLGELVAIQPGLEVTIALPGASTEYQQQVLSACEHHLVRWWLVPAVLHSLAVKLRVDALGVIPLISSAGSQIEGLNYAVKRTFDVAGASVLLFLTSPLLALGALAIWLADGWPILFRQTRIGVRGQPFEILKLRTMRAEASDNMHREYVRSWINQGADAAVRNGNNGGSVFKLTNDQRVTKVGRILRRFSIDELPQLINVLHGEMSLIGPRPALPYELELYQEWHRRRLEALPGITGLWQVSGRNHLSFDEMVRLDVQYLEGWSLGRDLSILARTVPALLRGGGW